MNCNTTHYRANSSSVPGDPTIADFLRVSKPGQTVRATILIAVAKTEKEVTVVLGSSSVEAPSNPQLEWEFASLAQLPDALAKATKEGKLVLVGLSGAET